jgi:exodeoxyribonuclease V alpha subunit
MNRGGVGARSLTIELQAALNPAGDRKVERFGWTFAPGDKVMQIENDYDKEVYNGDIGNIDSINPADGELVVNFDGRAVTYGFGELDMLVPAYAATIHKSQGSEYPAVVIPMMTQHYAMLQRNLLYTGVTRGKRLVVLVGQKKAAASWRRPAIIAALVEPPGTVLTDSRPGIHRGAGSRTRWPRLRRH